MCRGGYSNRLFQRIKAKTVLIVDAAANRQLALAGIRPGDADIHGVAGAGWPEHILGECRAGPRAQHFKAQAPIPLKSFGK